MSRPGVDQPNPSERPERMLASDATDFERRVLQAARATRPSAAASARMAKALGISVAAVGATGAATTAVAADAAAVKATAAATTAIWPWVSIGVVGLAVAGAVIGTGAPHRAAPHAAPPEVTAPPGALEQPAPVQPAAPPSAPSVAVTPAPRARVAAPPGDLHAEVAFIDSARDAVAAGAGRRALEILRRYHDKYPTGSFRPEAGAIKIEALMKIGREAEARALAERFVVEHRGSLLARRVADIAGIQSLP